MLTASSLQLGHEVRHTTTLQIPTCRANLTRRMYDLDDPSHESPRVLTEASCRLMSDYEVTLVNDNSRSPVERRSTVCHLVANDPTQCMAKYSLIFLPLSEPDFDIHGTPGKSSMSVSRDPQRVSNTARTRVQALDDVLTHSKPPSREECGRSTSSSPTSTRTDPLALDSLTASSTPISMSCKWSGPARSDSGG